jgi:hypothetical protein
LLQDATAGDKEKKAQRLSKEALELTTSMEALQKAMERIELPPKFVPNSAEHRAAHGVPPECHCFTSQVDQGTMSTILQLEDVPAEWKVLILVGVGVFFPQAPVAYAEIVKRLADQKKLYIIIAEADYIYGTNYPFFNAFIGKDMAMTQQKMIQACGRVGRFYDAKTPFSVCLRDAAYGPTLFLPPKGGNVEAVNMNQVFAD